MHTTQYLLSTLILCFCFFSACNSETDPSVTKTAANPLRLWYTAPAEDWMLEALPFGNGYMGAMYFGDPAEEHIQFTEESLWAGGPGAHPDYNYGIRENAHQYLPQIRALLEEGKFEEAHQLANQELTGVIHKKQSSEQAFGDFGSQQTMGDLYVSLAHQGSAEDYYRELNLHEGQAKVHYKVGEVDYNRTFFWQLPQKSAGLSL